MRQPALPLDTAVPSNFSATPRSGEHIAEAEDKDAMDGTDAAPPAWPHGKVFAEARTAVWTETEAGVRTGAEGKVFAETGITTGTGAWAEVGAEWRPVDREGGNLPSVPKGPAAWLGQQKLQTGQRDQAAFSSDLQAPAVGKPLGLLSKAAWTKSFSSSSSKTSSTKASPLPSPSSPASNKDGQTVGPNVSPVAVHSNSSSSNSSTSLGIELFVKYKYSFPC